MKTTFFTRESYQAYTDIEISLKEGKCHNASVLSLNHVYNVEFDIMGAYVLIHYLENKDDYKKIMHTLTIKKDIIIKVWRRDYNDAVWALRAPNNE